jgi:hypothetical protein
MTFDILAVMKRHNVQTLQELVEKLERSYRPRPQRTSGVRSTKTLVRRVPCPYCHALQGEKCIGVKGQRRDSNHTERIVEFEILAGLRHP